MDYDHVFDMYSSQSTQQSLFSEPSQSREPAMSGTGAWNTPIARTEHSTQTYGFDEKDSKNRYIRLSEEAERVALGPMPTKHFLRDFLPISQEKLHEMPPCEGAFDDIPEIRAESDIYVPLIQAINPAPDHPTRPHSGRCPGFALRNTSALRDESGGVIGSHQPDIVCYANEHLPFVQVKRRAAQRPLDAFTDMGFAAIFIEVKAEEVMDFFFDPPVGAARECWAFTLGRQKADRRGPAYKEAAKDLGQIISYAIEICARQHRRFCLSISISGKTARFMRWDRAGFIVSESFNYKENPRDLCEFFFRFAHLSDAERGYDLSVKPATAGEALAFAAALDAHILSQLGPSADGQSECRKMHFEPGSVTAIELPGHVSHSGIEKLLVSRPLTNPLSLTGRSTRAYWAAIYPPLTGLPGIVLLKDTWRLDDDYAGEVEGDILRLMQKQGVRNIPSVVCDWDIPVVDPESTKLNLHFAQ
ncbi:hypothetical protein BN946_scf184847.g5 [Trametes cinnabarina]|uniref:Fungal-type protein kinase domain-containing protein n=1 Tax=Pycnoporus cinnabarinus TaxID=5643 RepID=A0A060SJL8_PYCCI|nr:hypothetical protein BN946_scf184847.g5 [Trametes cinnabarina]